MVSNFSQRTKKLLTAITIAPMVFLPAIVFAAPKKSTLSPDQILESARDFLLGLVGSLVVLFIIIGGVQYITSNGSPDRAAAGKKTLTYAIFGLILVLLSSVILTVIQDIF